MLNFLKLFLIYFILTSNLDANSKIWNDGVEDEKILKDENLSKFINVFSNLVEKLNPTIVNIFSTQTVNPNNFYGMPEELFNLFENFYGRGFRNRATPRKATSLGSGFIINEDGYILTNNHVIKNAEEIKVKLFDESEFQAKVLGFDSETDIALIKIDANKKLPFASLGDSSRVKVGSWVLAIGNPFGHNHTVTKGLVSAKGRVLPEVSSYNDFIQTDASINQGNSGGPLIDIHGNVIGINTAIDPRGQGSIGFSIPIDEAKKILPRLAEGKTIVHESGWLGVGLENLSPIIARHLGIDENQTGVVVNEVQKNSPADKAGIKNYDIITKYNNKDIRNPGELAFQVKRTKPGSKVKIEVLRSGKKRNIELIIESRVAFSDEKETSSIQSSFGLVLENINQSTIARNNLNNVKPNDGVLVSQVQFNTPASKANIAVGDIIVEVNKAKVSNLEDYFNALKLSKNKEHLFRLKRGASFFVTVVTDK